MADENRLGRFINECRLSLGYTSRRVEELTRSRPGLTPISHSNLLAIEKGSHVPTYDKLLTIALVFNVPTQHFEDRLKQDMLGDSTVPSGTSFDALMTLGGTALDEGHHARALEMFTQAYQTAAPAELPAEVRTARAGEARLQAANCRARLGLLRVAKDDLEQILGEDSMPPRLVVRSSFLLAEIHRELKNHRLALLHARSALEAAETQDDLALRAKILNSIGNIYDDRGETAAAIRHYEESSALFARHGDRRAVALVARNLGTAYHRLGDVSSAVRYMTEGVVVARETGDRRGLAYGLANLARAHYLQGDVLRAKEHARQAKQIAQGEEYVDALFASLYYLWRIATSEGQVSLARVYADRLGVLHRKLESRLLEAEEWSNLSAAARRVRT